MKVFKKYISLILVTLFAFIMVLPLIWLIMISFMERKDLFSSPPSFGFSSTFANYYSVIFKHEILEVITNTFINSLIVSILSILISAPVLLTEIKNRTKGKELQKSLLLFYTLPASILAIPFFMYSMHLSLPKYMSYLIGLVSLSSLIVIIILTRYTSSFKRSVAESLIIYSKGKDSFSTFFIIFLDAKATFSLAFLFSFLIVWQDFLFGMLFSEGNYLSINVSIVGLITPVGTYWGEIAAMSVISVAMTMIISLPLVKLINKGFFFHK